MQFLRMSISSAILDIKTTTVAASGFPTADDDDLLPLDDDNRADLAPLLQRWAIDNAEEPCIVSDYVLDIPRVEWCI